MNIKYIFQKLAGSFLATPVFPKGKTTGYSLVKSEKSNCRLGKTVKVYPPFFLHDVVVDDYSYITKNASISNCTIGKFCSIGPNFCCGLGIHPTEGISTSPMFYSKARQNGLSLSKEEKVPESRMTSIGNDVFIGANVTVLDGVHIADGAVIGAGAVVVDDIPPYAIAVGIPARVVKYRFDDKTIERLLKCAWWDGTMDDLKEVERLFWDVDAFLNHRSPDFGTE